MNNYIYFIRRKNDIKQYDLAMAIGVSPSYLSKLETGKVNIPEKQKKACADFLKTPVEKLFSEEPFLKVFPNFFDGMKHKLWAIREMKGIKQRDFAKKLGVPIPTLSMIEAGLQEPTEEFKKKCVKELKMRVGEVFERKKNSGGNERVNYRSIIKDILNVVQINVEENLVHIQ